MCWLYYIVEETLTTFDNHIMFAWGVNVCRSALFGWVFFRVFWLRWFIHLTMKVANCLNAMRQRWVAVLNAYTRQLYSLFGYQIFYVSIYVKSDYNPRYLHFFLLVFFFFNLIYNLFLANGFFRRIQYFFSFSTWKLLGFHFCNQKGFHNPNNNRIELHTNNTFKEFCIEGHIIYV